MTGTCIRRTVFFTPRVSVYRGLTVLVYYCCCCDLIFSLFLVFFFFFLFFLFVQSLLLFVCVFFIYFLIKTKINNCNCSQSLINNYTIISKCYRTSNSHFKVILESFGIYIFSNKLCMQVG